MRTPFRVLELALILADHHVPFHVARGIAHGKAVVLFHALGRVGGIRSVHTQRTTKVQPEHRRRVFFRILTHRGVTNLFHAVDMEHFSNLGRLARHSRLARILCLERLWGIARGKREHRNQQSK